jgi:hypothetical protein
VAVKQRIVRQVEVLARMHTASAIDTLANIMEDSEKPAAARVAAANSILDRGWGRSAQIVGDASDEELLSDGELERAIRTRLAEISADVGQEAAVSAGRAEEEDD